MPKMKTNSGAKKRFTLTGTGKIKRKHAFKSHILTKKSTKRKRNLTYARTWLTKQTGKTSNFFLQVNNCYTFDKLNKVLTDCSADKSPAKTER